MKKLLLILLLFVGIGINTTYAQIYRYQTTCFAIKQVNSYGYWGEWSNREPSDMLITLNFDKSLVKIYSPITQTYIIKEYIGSYNDNGGGAQAEYKFVDQDGDIGILRLRIDNNGNSQIYIEFNNIMWVYGVKRIY